MNKKTLLIQKLVSYSVQFPEEKKLTEKFINLIESEEKCFYRDCFPGHITGSAWVIDSEKKALLMHHKKLGIWLQPGGHSDGNPDTILVARREVEEETGLQDLDLISDQIFDIDLHAIPKTKKEPGHFHYDIRFLFQAKNPKSISKNHESLDLQWFSEKDFFKLKKADSDCSVLRMFKKTKKLELTKQIEA